MLIGLLIGQQLLMLVKMVKHMLVYQQEVPQVVELNIGHFLIGEAIFVGLGEAMAKMRSLMQAARSAS